MYKLLYVVLAVTGLIIGWAGAEIEETIYSGLKSLHCARLILARPSVDEVYLQLQNRPSGHKILVASTIYSAFQCNGLSRKYLPWRVLILGDRLLLAVFQYLPTHHKFIAWNWPIVFGNCAKFHAMALTNWIGRHGIDAGLRTGTEELYLNILNSNIRSFGDHIGVLRYCYQFPIHTSLPTSQSSIDGNKHESDNLYYKSFVAAGFILSSFGIVLLSKFWWALSFNYSRKSNVVGDVAIVLFCMILVWVGMGLIGLGFHLVSFISLHEGQPLHQIIAAFL